MDEWAREIKQTLLRNERESINLRLMAWENIINECTAKAYSSIFNADYHFETFVNNVTNSEMDELLSLVFRWNGLQIHLIDTSKQLTFKRYEYKSRNWLNGSRAKHYSRTLYPYFIKCAEKYVQHIANKIFVINNDVENNHKNECKEIFINICMYSYLIELCSMRISVSKGSRKVYLLCDNSISIHLGNPTCNLLQKYAVNHKYKHQFPLYREDAIDYFQKEKEKDCKSLLMLTQKHDHKDIVKLLEYISIHCQTEDGKQIIIGREAFNIITDKIQEIEQETANNQQKIEKLQCQIFELQTNLHIISMINRLMSIDNNLLYENNMDINMDNMDNMDNTDNMGDVNMISNPI